MTLANVVYRQELTWSDPRVRTLEQQLLIPLTNEHPIELGFAGRTDMMVLRLAADEPLKGRFRAAFPDDPQPTTLKNVQRAIAAFERTMLSGNSRFDRYAFRGDVSALDASGAAGDAALLFVTARLWRLS